MKKHHALVLSLLLGAATVAGVVALTRAVALGQDTPTSSTAELTRREAALDQARRDIARLDASVPPALPPKTATATAAAAQRVVVVRATAPSATAQWEDDEAGGDEHEAEHGHESEDGWDD